MTSKFGPTREILGKKIKAIRPMTDEEVKTLGWKGKARAPVIELTGGAVLIPVADPDVKTPAVLYGADKKGNYVLGVTKDNKIFLS